jgi:hypothetical protein
VAKALNGKGSCSERIFKMNIRMAWLVGILFGITVSLHADWYVATNGTGLGTGGWSDATNNIQGAVNAASAGATIWVSNGIYRLTSQITIGDRKLRSWPDGLSSRDTTIINGNFPTFTNRCFTLSHANALVDGFTITNGFGTADGGGVSMSAGTLRNCLVTGNMTSNTTPIHGGGVYATGAGCMITNCDIIGNTAGGTSVGNQGGSGGGLRLNGGVQVWNSRIMYNRAPVYSGSGGGVSIYFTATMVNCQIISNTALPGGYMSGGLFIHGTVVLRNCLIMGNTRGTVTQSAGVGSHAWGGLNATIENCTIVNNRGCGISTAGGGGNYYLNNTISYLNDNNALSTDVGVMVMSNCCVSSTNNMTAGSSGNITNNPAFEDYTGGNYRLARESPCINYGIYLSWMLSITDLDGKTRIDKFSGKPDLGCYEVLPRGMMFKVR